jgi:hypothetical protein
MFLLKVHWTLLQRKTTKEARRDFWIERDWVGIRVGEPVFGANRRNRDPKFETKPELPEKDFLRDGKVRSDSRKREFDSESFPLPVTRVRKNLNYYYFVNFVRKGCLLFFFFNCNKHDFLLSVTRVRRK